MDASTWALVYQQQDISDNAVFDPVCVRGSIDGMRKSGGLNPGYPGHPKSTQGFHFICGLDPAMVGDTAAVCYAVDRNTHKRYIVDAIKITGPTPAQIRSLMFEWTDTYKPSEWIVERNAFQSFLTQDEGIRQYLATRGVILREHHTGNNKWDSGFGVASMSTLFGTKQSDGKHHRDNLIHLPSDQTENIKALIEQLITWSPTTKGKTDMVMALWFCEIRAREIINNGQHNVHHMKNPCRQKGRQCRIYFWKERYGCCSASKEEEVMPAKKKPKIFTPKRLPSDSDVMMPGYSYPKKMKKQVEAQRKKSNKK
jgi:hypothetical protein